MQLLIRLIDEMKHKEAEPRSSVHIHPFHRGRWKSSRSYLPEGQSNQQIADNLFIQHEHRKEPRPSRNRKARGFGPRASSHPGNRVRLDIFL